MKDLGGGLLIPSLVSKYMERGSLRDALDRKDEMDIKIMVWSSKERFIPCI